MTREEAIDWLCRLKSEIKIFMPYQWQKPFEEALDMAIKALEQEPITKNLGVEKIEVRKPCINYEDGCEEWAGCPCVHFKCRK